MPSSGHKPSGLGHRILGDAASVAGMDLSTDVPDGVGVSGVSWGLYLQAFGRTSKSEYHGVCRCRCLNSIVIDASI